MTRADMGGVVKSVVATIVLVAVIGGGYLLLRDRLSGQVQDLRVGDCFDVPAEQTTASIQHQLCTEAHDGEVFNVGNAELDGYPVVSGFDDWVGEHCLAPVFDAYVGEPLEDRPDIAIAYFAPTLDGWQGGDREITCYLTPADGSRVSSSFRVGGSPASN